MLASFIVANRGEIIERARVRAKSRSVPRTIESRVANGIPLFLTQLVDALSATSGVDGSGSVDGAAPLRLVTLDGAEAPSTSINDSASAHGRELLALGFTVPQVVHGYGDVCQVVTEMANENRSAISANDFHVFNRCLDDAIAGALTAYVTQRESDLSYRGTERLGVLAHELRNMLNTAVLSFDVMKRGTVGLSGSTAAMHARSLSGLQALVERSLAEVRLDAGVPHLESTSLAEFFEEVEVIATMQADGHGVELSVDGGGNDAAIDIDWQLLMSAVSNLLQNAFKFTRPGGRVSLTARVTPDRVLIEVGDQCGGLPPGKAEEMFRPFSTVRKAAAGSGLGLGLSIARRAAHANGGDLSVRDVPGKGCVFTVSLPRKASLPSSPSSSGGQEGPDGPPKQGTRGAEDRARQQAG